MNEPDAWQKTKLEQQLLDAAKRDQIPGELALQVGSALSTSSSASSSTSSIVPAASAAAQGGLLSTKAGLWGFLSIALLAGAGAFYAARAPSPAARVAPEAPAAQLEAATPRVASASLPAPALPAAVQAAAPAVRARAVPEAALREEIEVLDRAREALERGAAERALSLLDQHRRRFVQGTLVPEAEAMRIEALVSSGEVERAQRMSRRFLSAYPAHPLRERVSALTEQH